MITRLLIRYAYILLVASNYIFDEIVILIFSFVGVIAA